MPARADDKTLQNFAAFILLFQAKLSFQMKLLTNKIR